MLNCISPKLQRNHSCHSTYISRFKLGFNTENSLNEHITIININEPVEHGVYEAGGLDRVIAAKEELNGGDVESKDFPNALEESEMEKLVAVQHYLSTTATVTI